MKPTSSIPKAEVGESPHVAEADGVTHHRQHEVQLAAPLEKWNSTCSYAKTFKVLVLLSPLLDHFQAPQPAPQLRPQGSVQQMKG